MKLPVAACLLLAALLGTISGGAAGQPPKDDKKPAPPPKFGPPAKMPPDAATLKQITEKTEQLRAAVVALKAKQIPDDVLVEVEIHLKAAENIVRFEEWYAKDSGKWALLTLDRGLERAKLAEGGKAPWRDAPGKWVLRAYRSKVDWSIQPYAVLLPHDYGKDPEKKWRLDVVLHGRDSSITEAKFIATHNGTAPKDRDFIQLEVYGRGNNAYRWAGETDVYEAINAIDGDRTVERHVVDRNRFVLRGFSMGGAGTWHLGLRDPSTWCVIGPGAGFTTTHGYVSGLPATLPEYQEKCLRIYDAVDYVENAFNVPVVAYSGEKDPQKKAADNIENALKAFKEPVRFTHLVAPGLEHQMPAEWQAKAQAEYRKYADKGRAPNPNRIRFVTYTPTREHGCDWIGIDALETTYEKAVVDARREGDRYVIVTQNVRRLLFSDNKAGRIRVTIDGQEVQFDRPQEDNPSYQVLEKQKGKWVYADIGRLITRLGMSPEKDRFLRGPIDDAFTSGFVAVGGTGGGWPDANLKQFAKVWDKYFRGTLLTTKAADYHPAKDGRHLVLFGDAESNPLIAKVLPKLPITWTKDKLVVNGVEYDPKTHYPVLIYPNPLNGNTNYVVINSGHTFKEADLKGTNALLYPRLGDWAVVKPTPTDKDPAAYEVVAAGLFDENWQFPRK